MIDDPLSLVLLSSWLMAAGMYPLGFLFGACSDCCNQCSNATCDGFDLEEVYDRRSGGRQVCGLSLASGATTFTSNSLRFHEGCRVTGDNIADMTFITGKAALIDGTWRYTFAPPTSGAVVGCITVCGTSGLCSVPSRPTDEGCGNYGTGTVGDSMCEGGAPARINGCGAWYRRRSCVRWVCRCYQSTGQRAAGNNTVSEWYTVVSTTVVGGPTTNNINLGNQLQAQQCDGMSVEEYYLSQTNLGSFLNSEAGTVGCLIWAFTFYGWVADCETPWTGTPTQHRSRDDCYSISVCTRCD